MTYKERLIKESTFYNCPSDHFDNAPKRDEITTIEDGDLTTGCRGITCIECWNQEEVK